MISILRAVTRTTAGAALIFGAACSNSFVEVTNPDRIDAATVDPTSGATALAFSAQQNFATAIGWLSMYSGWFTEEANVADTFPTRNEFGFRLITDLNGSLNGDVWQPISLAAASAKTVMDLELPTPTSNINYARAATFRGYAILTIATDFCSGTLSSGPLLTTTQLLDSAIVYFTKGVDIGKAAATTDGTNLSNAALVGRARAKLQKGDKAGASADAALVPAGFNFNLQMTDDLANRTRLSNRLYQFTFDRSSISVAPFFRVSDTRVPYIAPGQPGALNGQDAVPGGFYRQTKYNAYNTAFRLASKLEADYIAAEAGGDVNAQITLINARRTAGGKTAYAGATDAASVLKELMVQKAFDFYLEGKRIADFRRVPAAMSGITPSGGTYFKPGYANVGTQTCYPLPRVETDNNPNLKTN
ncbi:MAG: hypothetical protein FJ363_06570 [Gemmatimonadetes bacterium]|nr:hypothetical protein [Gemmatimonadota bacterium]